jgi:PAS domain S-box-containing protein
MAFLLAALAVFALSTLITGPLQRIVDTTEEIAAGDFSRRALVEGDDEVSHLARSFNRMVERIEGWNASLESRVAERTLELAESEEQYRLLFERNLAGVYMSTEDGTVFDCNDACAQLLGYSGRADLLSAVTMNDDRLARRERARGVQHVGQQRPAGERMQDFRQRGAHALAQARRENDDVERHGQDSSRNSTLLTEALAAAFARVALANTERELLIGTFVMSPPHAKRQPESPDEFLAITAPGYAKAVMNFRVQESPLAMSVVTTETRVWATDERTERKFALYWWTIRLGSGLIRQMWLRAIRRRAERIGS